MTRQIEGERRRVFVVHVTVSRSVHNFTFTYRFRNFFFPRKSNGTTRVIISFSPTTAPRARTKCTQSPQYTAGIVRGIVGRYRRRTSHAVTTRPVLRAPKSSEIGGRCRWRIDCVRVKEYRPAMTPLCRCTSVRSLENKRNDNGTTTSSFDFKYVTYG